MVETAATAEDAAAAAFFQALPANYDPRFFDALHGLELPMDWRPRFGQGGGGYLGSRDGGSLEFRQHRPYAPGDDLRRLDWRVYARSQRAYTRLHHDERFPYLNLLLDTSASMGHELEDKWRTALDVALALAYVGLANACHVRLQPWAEEPGQALNWRSLRSLRTEGPAQLARLRPAGNANFDGLAHLAHQWRRDGALVVLISDFLLDVPELPPRYTGWQPEIVGCENVPKNARRRLAYSVERLQTGLAAFATERFRLVAVQLRSDPTWKNSGFVQDSESGELLRLHWSRKNSEQYQQICTYHQQLLKSVLQRQHGGFCELPTARITTVPRPLVVMVLEQFAALPAGGARR